MEFKKLEEVGNISKQVSKKIATRLVFLLDYDKLYNEYETLCERQERNELSLKQSNGIYSLKRKLEDSKIKYDSINGILKACLPKFLHYVFYLVIVAKLTKVQPVEESATIISSFKQKNDPLFNDIEQLSIIAFNRPIDYAKPIFEANLGFCYALYDFHGVEPGDLSFKKGNRIKILERTGDWWQGEIKGKQGLFPSNYVKLE